MVGALTGAGLSEAYANVYAEGVRRGGTLVSVRTDDANAARVDSVLAEHRGVDAMSRGNVYRKSGWTAYDPASAPYTDAEIAEERARYGY